LMPCVVRDAPLALLTMTVFLAALQNNPSS
jgi:hypothetical protein